MTLKEELLLMLHFVGPKVVSKTRVMKYAYFLEQLLNSGDMGFRPHFYGPYSEQVSDTLGVLAFVGLVEQKRTALGMGTGGYEKVLYEYSLTKDGSAVAEALVAQHPKRAKRIESAVVKLRAASDGYTYMELSCAAKAHFLLRDEGRMTVSKIVDKAKTFNWKLDPREVKRCAKVLVTMNLAQASN